MNNCTVKVIGTNYSENPYEQGYSKKPYEQQYSENPYEQLYSENPMNNGTV